MKKIILFLLLLNYNSYSQHTFEKGHFIDNSNKKIICLIKNTDPKNNPSKFLYKLTEEGDTKERNIENTKEFEIYNFYRYERNTVNIDLPDEKPFAGNGTLYNIKNLSKSREFFFKEKTIFLKSLVKGIASLYSYSSGNWHYFFYSIENKPIEQLVYKKYPKDDNIAEFNYFKQQLSNDLKSYSLEEDEIKKLKYNEKQLVNFFFKINNPEKDINSKESKINRKSFGLDVRPRLRYSNLNFEKSSGQNLNFEDEFSFSFGLEFQYILPYNNNKWAILIEPNYSNYNSAISFHADYINDKILIANVDYKSIDLPIGLRHNFFLTKKSLLFANISYSINFVFDSSFRLDRSDGTNFQSDELDSRNNLNFGIGYKLNNKYSLELRYNLSRKISDVISWDFELQSLSIIFGYSLF